MKEFSQARLRKDRVQLMRALKDIEFGKIGGMGRGDRSTIMEMLTVKITEIDRLLDISTQEK
jgi:hypothetical protein